MFSFLRYVIGTTSGHFYKSHSYSWDQWYHAAMVMSPWDENTGSNGITVYSDGVQRGTDTSFSSRGDEAVPGNVVIGRRAVGSDSLYSSLIVDEVTIFDKEIPEEDIRKIYEMSAPSM